MWSIYRENEKAIKLLQVSIMLHLVLCCLVVFYDVQLLIHFQQTNPGMFLLASEYYTLIHSFQFITFFLMFLAYIQWLKRIIANFELFTSLPIRVISGQVDLYHLIPILQIYKPFQALKDAFHVLEADEIAEESGFHPRFWEQLPTPAILNLFWGSFWLIVVIKIYAIWHMDWTLLFHSRIGAVYQGQPLFFVTDFLVLICYSSFFIVVQKISNKHLLILQEYVLLEYQLDSPEDLSS